MEECEPSESTDFDSNFHFNRLLQASNQAQMAQQNALAAAAGLSTYNHNARRASHHHNQYSNGVLAGSAGGSGCSSGRRKSTIGGIFYRSTEDDLLEAAKLNSPFMGHPESNYESNIVRFFRFSFHSFSFFFI